MFYKIIKSDYIYYLESLFYSIVYIWKASQTQYNFKNKWSDWCLIVLPHPHPPQCRSESSHSDEESSVEEEEDDAVSLSPASSASCHQPPPPVETETSAPSCLPTSPSQWSVEEVSQFISSLQGWRIWRFLFFVFFVLSKSFALFRLFYLIINHFLSSCSCQAARSSPPSSCHRKLMDRLCSCWRRSTSCPPWTSS